MSCWYLFSIYQVIDMLVAPGLEKLRNKIDYHQKQHRRQLLHRHRYHRSAYEGNYCREVVADPPLTYPINKEHVMWRHINSWRHQIWWCRYLWNNNAVRSISWNHSMFSFHDRFTEHDFGDSEISRWYIVVQDVREELT